MAFGICPVAYMPLREHPRESSQMVSALLFGETYEVLQSNNAWHYVRMRFDGYEGWLFTRMHYWVERSPDVTYLTAEPFLEVESTGRKLYLGLGTPLPGFKDGSFKLGDEGFATKGEVVKVAESDHEQVRLIAEKFLETPYLWGGRCGFGIDCSGFTQILMRYAGIAISRDAKDQVNEGMAVEPKEAQKGDLAFFQSEEGRIVHSGFIENQRNIIHASGKVRRDVWDEKGIYNQTLQSYTHRFYGIRRF